MEYYIDAGHCGWFFHTSNDASIYVCVQSKILSSPNFATIKEDRLVIVSELGSMFDGMDLLLENEVNAILTSDVEHQIVDWICYEKLCIL